MGGNPALLALERGHGVVSSSRSEKPRLAEAGAEIVGSPGQMVGELPPPRVVLLSLPAGETTDQTVTELCGLLEPGDVVADEANSHWEDSKRRHRELAQRGVRFLDAGVSGGEEGAFRVAEPLLRDLAVEGGLLHAGPPGSGHFVKLVHNMIEFGMVQAIGEGVGMLQASEYDHDMPALFANWNHGSVIRGWLVGLMERSFEEHGGDLGAIEDYVEGTGEHTWGVEYAMDKEIPIPLLAQAVWGFYESRDPDRAWAKAVAALRNQYGGHPVRKG